MAEKSPCFPAECGAKARRKAFLRTEFGKTRPNAYICDLILSSMQQFLRYFFSLLCVRALFAAPQVRAASAEVAEGPSEQMMTATQAEVNIALRGNQLRVTNANGLTVEVYNITGVKVFVHRVDGDDRTFTLTAERGIYIVKVGKVVRRVTLL